MSKDSKISALILGVSILLGLAVLGYLLGNAAIKVKGYERSVSVKGLAEREVLANIVIWPIVFTEASNDLNSLYASIETGGGPQKLDNVVSSESDRKRRI